MRGLDRHMHRVAGVERIGGAQRLEPVLPDQIAMATAMKFLALLRRNQRLVARGKMVITLDPMIWSRILCSGSM